MARTYGSFIEVEEGRAEILFTLGEDLVGAGAGVRRRRPIERWQFWSADHDVAFLLGKLRETAFPSKRFRLSQNFPRGYEARHFLVDV